MDKPYSPVAVPLSLTGIRRLTASPGSNPTPPYQHPGLSPVRDGEGELFYLSINTGGILFSCGTRELVLEELTYNYVVMTTRQDNIRSAPGAQPSKRRMR